MDNAVVMFNLGEFRKATWDLPDSTPIHVDVKGSGYLPLIVTLQTDSYHGSEFIVIVVDEDEDAGHHDEAIKHRTD